MCTQFSLSKFPPHPKAQHKEINTSLISNHRSHHRTGFRPTLIKFCHSISDKKQGADDKAAHTCLRLPSKLPAEFCHGRNLFSLCSKPGIILLMSPLGPCSRALWMSHLSWAISSSNIRFSSLLSLSCFSSSSFFLLLSSNSELEGEIVKERDNYTHPGKTPLKGKNMGDESPVKCSSASGGSKGDSIPGAAVLGKGQSPWDTSHKTTCIQRLSFPREEVTGWLRNPHKGMGAALDSKSQESTGIGAQV